MCRNWSYFLHIQHRNGIKSHRSQHPTTTALLCFSAEQTRTRSHLSLVIAGKEWSQKLFQKLDFERKHICIGIGVWQEGGIVVGLKGQLGTWTIYWYLFIQLISHQALYFSPPSPVLSSEQPYEVGYIDDWPNSPIKLPDFAPASLKS